MERLEVMQILEEKLIELNLNNHHDIFCREHNPLDGTHKESEAAAIDPSSFNAPWVDVRAYKAKGDGVTDDTTAIQSAIAAAEASGGGTVYLPATGSEYIISSPLLISTGGICLRGDTSSSYQSKTKGTRIKLAASSDCGMIRVNGPAEALGNIIEYIFLDGQYGSQGVASTYGIRIEGGTDVTVRHCRFYRIAGYAIRADHQSKILYNWVHKTKQNALYMDGNDSVVIGNLVTARDDSGNYYAGIYNSGHNSILSNNMVFQSSVGIYMAMKGICNNNRVNHNQKSGIVLGATGVTCVGNYGYCNGVDTGELDKDRSGIKMIANECSVIGNLMKDEVAGATQTLAVYFDAGLTGCRIQGNCGKNNTIGIYSNNALGVGSTLEGIGREDCGAANTQPTDASWANGDFVENVNGGASDELWLKAQAGNWICVKAT